MASLGKRKTRSGTTTESGDERVDDSSPSLQTPTQPGRGRSKPRKPPQDIGIAQLLLGAGAVPLAGAALAGGSQRPLGADEAAGTEGSASQGLTSQTLQRACDFLSGADPRLAPLIAEHGAPERLLAKQGDAFATLSKSIAFQQLATQAAAVIFNRVLQACQCADAGILHPAAVLATPHEALCGAGLSRAKASYLHDLAAHFADGRLSNAAIAGMGAPALRTALTAVRGLGPWSVDMFTMFHLGLPDVLPVGDLGVRRGMQALYGLRDLPSPAQMEAVAERWRPWRSVGAYYMWRVEAPRGAKKAGGGAGSKKRA